MGLLTKVLELITAVICWVTAQEQYLATRRSKGVGEREKRWIRAQRQQSRKSMTDRVQPTLLP